MIKSSRNINVVDVRYETRVIIEMCAVSACMSATAICNGRVDGSGEMARRVGRDNGSHRLASWPRITVYNFCLSSAALGCR